MERLIGSGQFFQTLRAGKTKKLLGFAASLLLAGVWAGFLGLGGKAYAEDVAIIESEMVDTAKWASTHLDPGALIAVHDIGAMGFFRNRPLVDLAGLISPDVIPFIRDDDRLAAYLNERGVKYLVVFPHWYDRLAQGLEVIFTTEGQFSPQAGGEKITIYQW